MQGFLKMIFHEQEGMIVKKWKCTVCGYIHEGDAPPEKCPQCGAPKEKFVLLADSSSDIKGMKPIAAA